MKGQQVKLCCSSSAHRVDNNFSFLSLSLFSQWLSAGLHDRHHNGIHAAVPQTGAHPNTLPRCCYLIFIFFTPVLCPAPLSTLFFFICSVPSNPSPTLLAFLQLPLSWVSRLCFLLVHICFGIVMLGLGATAPPSGAPEQFIWILVISVTTEFIWLRKVIMQF